MAVKGTAPETTCKPGALPALTGLRFFAAFFILFAHANDWILKFTDSEIRNNLNFVTMYGMPLFFVLSGFVIHYNYHTLFEHGTIWRSVYRFGVARFARIYPLFFVMLIFAIVVDQFIYYLMPRPDAGTVVLLSELTLTQSWHYAVYDGKAMVQRLFGLSWSVSTEMFFYLTYPFFVAPLLNRIKGARRALCFAVAFAAAAYAFFIAIGPAFYWDKIMTLAKHYIPGYISPEEQYDTSFSYWLFYYSPYVRVFEFWMGCAAAHAFVQCKHIRLNQWQKKTAIIIMGLSLTFMVSMGALLFIPTRISGYVSFYREFFLCAPAIAALLFCLARYSTKLSRFLAHPWLVALGERSFSIYLIHTWTLRVFIKDPVAFSDYALLDASMRVGMAILSTLIFSHATYQLIEMPARRWIRKRLG